MKKLIPLFLSLFLLILIRTAWVSSDGYTILRNADNWVNGFGLTYNIQERVCSFTCPLWTILLSGIYWITREGYFTSIFSSIILSLLFACFLMSRKSENYFPLLAISCIISSKVFIDYSTSGLENSLSYLLLILFFISCFKNKILLSHFLACLIILNRLDLLLIILPFTIYLFFKSERKVKFRSILIYSPFLAWELFSLIYYGWLLPNTYYAKIETGISTSSVLKQGFCYYLDSIDKDPVTLLIIFMTIILCTMQKKWLYIIGISAYLFYILKIGGYFMSGRFFTIPFLVSLIAISEMNFKDRDLLAMSIIIVFIGIINPLSPLKSDGSFANPRAMSENGITDERSWYYQKYGLLKYQRDKQLPYDSMITEILSKIEKEDLKLVGGFLGARAFLGKRDTYTLSGCCLADPLRSHLLSNGVLNIDWRTGHFTRAIPDGYEKGIIDGHNQIQDPYLHWYYELLRVVIMSKDLLSLERLKIIWNFNVGKYDWLLIEYHKKIGYIKEVN